MTTQSDTKSQALFLWGDDRVKTIQDFWCNGQCVPKGTEGRIPMIKSKIVVLPNENVCLYFSNRVQKRRLSIQQTGIVEIPAKFVQRVSGSFDCPTGYGQSLSICYECKGGSCSL